MVDDKTKVRKHFLHLTCITLFSPLLDTLLLTLHKQQGPEDMVIEAGILVCSLTDTEQRHSDSWSDGDRNDPASPLMSY